MNNTDSSLCSLEFWDRLSAEEKKLIERSAVVRDCIKDEIISSRCESCLGMTLVISGMLRAFILSEEGREITLFRLAKNDVCVLSASCVMSQINFDTHIIADEQTRILIIPSGILSEIVEKNIYARCFMYEKMTERFSSVMFSLQQILFMRFDSRLASFLIAECNRTGKDEINMTHEQIAQHVNSAREVVARMLKRFSSDGLIEMKRGSIRITDTEKLKKLL